MAIPYLCSPDLKQPLLLDGDAGALQQVPQSRGYSLPPIWVTRANKTFIQDAIPSPTDSIPGDRWIKSDSPNLTAYTYLDDGSSLQWVSIDAGAIYTGPLSYAVSVNFGAQPTDSGNFTITSIPAVTTQKVFASPSAVDGDELECDMLMCAAYVTATNTINLFVNAFPGPVSGTRNLVLLVS